MEWNATNTQIRLSTTMGSKENNQMLKIIVLTSPLLAMGIATAAAADNVKADVQDFYKTITESVPYEKRSCYNVEVPIYETVTRNGGASGGDVLGGMIIGGILGKGLTGKDNGAAAGAVMGGIIAADKANKPKTERVITGYRQERKCEMVTAYRDQQKSVYDYSQITWRQDGQVYSFTFEK